MTYTYRPQGVCSQRMEVEVEDGVVYHKTEYRERRNHYSFYAVNTPIDGFDTDMETFLGMYNGFENPQAVLTGKMGNSVASGWQPMAAHQIKVHLEKGEAIIAFPEQDGAAAVMDMAVIGLLQIQQAAPEDVSVIVEQRVPGSP